MRIVCRRFFSLIFIYRLNSIIIIFLSVFGVLSTERILKSHQVASLALPFSINHLQLARYALLTALDIHMYVSTKEDLFIVFYVYLMTTIFKCFAEHINIIINLSISLLTQLSWNENWVCEIGLRRPPLVS